MKHLLSMSRIGRNREEARENTARIIFESLRMIPIYAKRQIIDAQSVGFLPPVLTSLFLEPSTRTMLSTEIAAELAGFRVSSQITSEASSLKKGETMPNTVRMMGQYLTSVVVVRSHIEGLGVHLANIIERTAGPMSWVPKEVSILVGGSGTRDHPSQVLLDLTTLVLRRLGIRKIDEYQKVEDIIMATTEESLIARIKDIIDGLNIAFVGDLLHSRVTHDWIHLGHWFDVKFVLIAPSIFQIEPWCLKLLDPSNYTVSEDMRDALNANYTYMIRLQVERLKELMTESSAREIAGRFAVTEQFLKDYRGEVLDAQPVDQYSPAVPPSLWNHPKVIMFMQSAVGVPTRMAIIRFLYQGRTEGWDILPLPAYKLDAADIEREATLADHRQRMIGKHAERDVFFNQVNNGTVIDRIAPGCAGVITAINQFNGLYSSGHGPILVATDVPSVAMERKEMILLHDLSPSYELAAIYGLVCPEIKVIFISQAVESAGGKGYRRIRFSLPEVVAGVFSCPNNNCVTNYDPEAKTHFQVLGVKDSPGLECSYCGHVFPAKTVVDLFRKSRSGF